MKKSSKSYTESYQNKIRRKDLQMKKKKILSDWSKAIKHAMIDQDMDINDIAEKFHWTPQYVSGLINGRIYFIEPVKRLSVFFNIEEMIAAATKELQEENEELKQYRIPGYLIEHGRAYECPACGREISAEEIEGLKSKTVKYCNNCGKRIMLSKISSYAKNYANNLVDVKHE